MNLSNLEKVFGGKPSFYLKGAKKAVFGNLIEDWTIGRQLISAL